MPVLPGERDGGVRRVRAAARELRLVVLEAVRQHDPHPVLGAGDRIADRLDHRLDQARDPEAAAAGGLVVLELDAGEDRLVDLVDGRGQNVEDGRPGLGLLALEDSEDSVHLLAAGALVDDRQNFAAALVDRPRPGDQLRPGHAIEDDRTKMPALDPHGDRGPAIAMGRQGVELAGAAPGAVAGVDLERADAPVDAGHDDLQLCRAHRSAIPGVVSRGSGRRRHAGLAVPAVRAEDRRLTRHRGGTLEIS